MWKQKLGCDATYQKLIDTFEDAGYHSYADIIRNIVGLQSDKHNMDDHNQLLPQPETYPHPKPEIPSSDTFLRHRPSSCDEFLLINPDAARNLSESENIVVHDNMHIIIMILL